MQFVKKILVGLHNHPSNTRANKSSGDQFQGLRKNTGKSQGLRPSILREVLVKTLMRLDEKDAEKSSFI